MRADTTTATNILQIQQIASIFGGVVFVLAQLIESNKTDASRPIESNMANTRADEAIIHLAALSLGEWRLRFPTLVREARAPADYSSS